MTRRSFLAAVAGALAAPLVPARLPAIDPQRPTRIVLPSKPRRLTGLTLTLVGMDAHGRWVPIQELSPANWSGLAC